MADVDALFDSGSDDDDFQIKPRAPVAASPSDSGEGNKDVRVPQAPANPARLMRHDDELDDDEVDVVDYGRSRDDSDGVPQGKQAGGAPAVLEGPLLDYPDSSELRLAKLSNILGIETRPFDPAAFEREEDVYTDETGQRRLRLMDQNTIRWRYVKQPDGTVTKQSNARFVRWSDGSVQLFLGDEVMDVAEHDMSAEHNYLFVRHSQFIQGQGALTKKIAFRPASLDSKFHKRLTAKIDVRYTKTTKVKATATVKDPVKEKRAREKAEEERIRSKELLERRQEASMKKYGSAVRRARPSGRMGGITAEYLEAADEEGEYDDEEDEGLTATERARQSLARSRRTDEQAEREAERRLAEAKREPAPRMAVRVDKRRRAASDSDEAEVSDDDEEEEVEDSDDEPPQKTQKGTTGKRYAALVISDDDSD